MQNLAGVVVDHANAVVESELFGAEVTRTPDEDDARQVRMSVTREAALKALGLKSGGADS